MYMAIAAIYYSPLVPAISPLAVNARNPDYLVFAAAFAVSLVTLGILSFITLSPSLTQRVHSVAFTLIGFLLAAHTLLHGVRAPFRCFRRVVLKWLRTEHTTRGAILHVGVHDLHPRWPKHPSDVGSRHRYVGAELGHCHLPHVVCPSRTVVISFFLFVTNSVLGVKTWANDCANAQASMFPCWNRIGAALLLYICINFSGFVFASVRAVVFSFLFMVLPFSRS